MTTNNKFTENKTFGSNTGDYVFFTGNLINRLPKDKGYYGIITGCSAAMNYNQDARYNVDVFNNGTYKDSIVTTWNNLSTK